MCMYLCLFIFFFSSRRRHTRLQGDWSSDVCSSDLEWRYRALLELARGYILEFRSKALKIRADKKIRSDRNRRRSFAILPHREARNAKIGGLLLNPPGVCDHYLALFDEADEIKVTHRLNQPKTRCRGEHI